MRGVDAFERSPPLLAAHTHARTRTRGSRCTRKQRSCIGRSTGVNHTANTRTRRCVHAPRPSAPPLAVGARCADRGRSGRAVARTRSRERAAEARGETRDSSQERSNAERRWRRGTPRDARAFAASRASSPAFETRVAAAAHGRRRARETKADFFARGDAARRAADSIPLRTRRTRPGIRAPRAHHRAPSERAYARPSPYQAID